MEHMGQDERRRIEFMLGCGDKVADIARALGRSESTISREELGDSPQEFSLGTVPMSSRDCPHERLSPARGCRD